MLEQIAYEIPRIQEIQPIFQVGDLEGLSAVALYDKKYIKGTDSDSEDDMTLNFYHWTSLVRFGETTLGVQNPGESHKDYVKRMKESGGFTTIVPTVSGGNSGY